MSQKLMQKEILQILDDWNDESGALAKKCLKEGGDRHPEKFKAIRDKYMNQLRELGKKYGITPKDEVEQ